ncbi:MAG: subclass B1 metallo-beta-lactamase [Colwellia sp.]|nr:subclass B1 metallo-beta-lactamase [Colwellia sp.]
MRHILFLCIIFSSMAFANKEVPKPKITKLADNVYQHISYKRVGSYGIVGASGLVVIDGVNAHIIDTPWTVRDTKKLVAWIASKGLTLKSAVVTHFHKDASGGLSFLNSLKIKTYATPLTNKLLDSKQREKSNHEIKSNEYELLTNKIEVFYPGAGHSQDNIVVWLPEEKILFGGCFVKSINSKGLGFMGHASVKDWPISIQKVIKKYPNVERVVPGHGEIGDISLLRHTAQLALVNKGL